MSPCADYLSLHLTRKLHSFVQMLQNSHKLLEQEGFQQLPWHTDTHGTPPGPMGGIKAGLLGGPSQGDPKAQLGLFLLGMTKDGIVP